MKKTIFFIILLFFCSSINGWSQDDADNTLDNQFNELIQKSNSYQEFKVIKKVKLRHFQQNMNDSLELLEANIRETKTTIADQKNKIEEITNQVEDLEEELAQTQQEVDSIYFLGSLTQKSVYNSIMWGIIIVLFLLSAILFIIFKKGNRTTRAAKDNLAETEAELENLRKTSLKREQKISRELQDEINKNRSQE